MPRFSNQQEGLVAVTMEAPRSEMQQIREGLHCSTWEAVFATVHLALTQGVFLTHYVLDLGASNFLCGVVESLPFLTQFCYFLSPLLVRKYRYRKPVVILFSAIHRLAWIPLIGLLYLDTTPAVRQTLMVLTLFGANASAVIAQNAWFSWMTDLIPPAIRGSYYGRRNAYLGFTSMIALLIGSQVLTFFKDLGMGHAGYTICFSVAVASALFSARMLWKQHEPGPVDVPKIPLRHLYRITRERRLLFDYIRFSCLWQFSLGIAAAFFGVHMVKTLKMSPALMAYQGLLASIAALLGSRLWGKARDRVGDRAVLLSSGVVICLNVWIWLPAREGFLLPVWILSIIAGFGWSGFQLASFSWPQRLCGREDRQYTFGLLGLFSGPAFLVGSLFGGAITTFLPNVLFHIDGLEILHFHVAFGLSSIGRLTAIVLLARWSLQHDRKLRRIPQCLAESFSAMLA